MDEIARWFRALSSPLRIRLFGSPAVQLTGEEVVEVSRSGVLLAAAWFPAVQDGPSGFYLPHDVAGFIEDERSALDEWWSALTDSDKAEWLAYDGGPLTKRVAATTPLAYSPVADDRKGVQTNPVLNDYLVARGHRSRG